VEILKAYVGIQILNSLFLKMNNSENGY